MAKEKVPTTQAVRMLNAAKAQFTIRPYKYVDRGGTSVAAGELKVDEHRVIKTLVMERTGGAPLVVLMHGDREVSTKSLARALGVKTVSPCTPAAAHKHTGYTVGGISPFGTRTRLDVYMEETILDCPVIYINAGKRGLLVEMPPGELVRILEPVTVTVAL